MIMVLPVLALQLFCAVDIIRNGRNRYWLSIVIFLPVAGSLAYLLLEKAPELRGNRHVRVAQQKIVQKIDPERDLRAAKQALDIADTMANHLRMADALAELARHKEALPHYQRGAGAIPDFRTGEKLARSLFLNDCPDQALAVLDKLPKVWSQTEVDRAGLLRARVLEELNRTEEALTLYAEVSQRLGGDEARCRYAALLLKVGREADAQSVLEDVERRIPLVDRYTRAEAAPMYDWALNELAALRA